ncbi:MAG: class I SAM-dependent methyltransferase, partial [Desulfomonilaceae bacterium]
TRCPLCDGFENKILFVKEGFRHVRCLGCGLVYVNPRLKIHGHIQTFSGTGSMGEESLSSAQVLRICKELSKFNSYRRINRLLEIGPGKGWFLRMASLTGWDTWAVEINVDAIESLRRMGVTKIIKCSAEEFETDPDSFDVIRIWDVIEHLEWPQITMERVFRALRPGGLLRLSTTNFNSLSRMINGPEWVYLNGADHIILFDPLTIKKLLLSVGFKRIRLKTRSFNLRRKLYHPEKDIKVRFHPLTPLRKIIDETIKFSSFGHQMIVEAVKDA